MEGTQKMLRCFLVAALCWLHAAVPAGAACGETGVQLQMLGAGGPGSSGGSASSGYLVWVDGVSRILIDAGGGTKGPFHKAGASLADLQFIGLSHFHPDHSAELPALLWPRGATLRIAGPSQSDAFPSLDDWLEGMFGARGVFRVLGDRVDLDAVTVDVKSEEPTEVFRDGDLRVAGTGVPHGDVPTVGYRVDVGAVSVAFSSDQNGSNPGFIEFVRDVNLLVVHFAGRENSTGRGAELHAKPNVWGQMAADAGVGHLVLSHISDSSDDGLETNLLPLRANYTGPLTIGEDLLCMNVG